MAPGVNPRGHGELGGRWGLKSLGVQAVTEGLGHLGLNQLGGGDPKLVHQLADHLDAVGQAQALQDQVGRTALGHQRRLRVGDQLEQGVGVTDREVAPPRSGSFGEQLRSLREGAGLSRPDLARKAGVPVSTLRNWEADRGFPALPALIRFARVLGVPVERFAEGVDDRGEDEPPPEKPGRGRRRQVR